MNETLLLLIPPPAADTIPEKAKRGRPAKHESAAARQKAYRARLKASGMRELKVWTKDVRDSTKPLASALIDLSEVRSQRFLK